MAASSASFLCPKRTVCATNKLTFYDRDVLVFIRLHVCRKGGGTLATQSLSTLCDCPQNSPLSHHSRGTDACYYTNSSLTTPGIVKISVKLHYFYYYTCIFKNLTGAACPQTPLPGCNVSLLCFFSNNYTSEDLMIKKAYRCIYNCSLPVRLAWSIVAGNINQFPIDWKCYLTE